MMQAGSVPFAILFWMIIIHLHSMYTSLYTSFLYSQVSCLYYWIAFHWNTWSWMFASHLLSLLNDAQMNFNHIEQIETNLHCLQARRKVFSFKSTLALNVVGAACLLIQLYNQIKRGPCPVHRKCNIWTLSNLVLTICWFEQLFWITRIMIISFECFKSVMNNDHMFEQLFRIIIICWFEQLFWIMGINEIWFWIIKISYE